MSDISRRQIRIGKPKRSGSKKTKTSSRSQEQVTPNEPSPLSLDAFLSQAPKVKKESFPEPAPLQKGQVIPCTPSPGKKRSDTRRSVFVADTPVLLSKLGRGIFK
jgi:hypothetical protein